MAVSNKETIPGLISVVVPVFNTRQYLPDCLDSLIQQNYSNMEVIIINDGSTDGSEEVIQKYTRSHSFIRSITQTNKGVSAARNSGINEARGEFIFFLDSDDYLVPNAFSKCMEAINAHEADIVLFSAKLTSSEFTLPTKKEFIWSRPSKILHEPKSGADLFTACNLTDGFFNTMSSMYLAKDSCIQDLRFHLNLLHEDNVFTPQLMLNANKAVVIPDKLLIHRIRSNSIMTTRANMRNVADIFTGCELLLPVLGKLPMGKIKYAYSIQIQKSILSAISIGQDASGGKMPRDQCRRARAIIGQIPMRYRLIKVMLSVHFTSLAMLYLKLFIKRDIPSGATQP